MILKIINRLFQLYLSLNSPCFFVKSDLSASLNYTFDYTTIVAYIKLFRFIHHTNIVNVLP